MEFLLISNVDDSRLFTLNALTNSILSFFKEKVPVISLVLISESKVDDNFLFLKGRYLDVDYISRFNQLKKLKKKEYDYLISIDHSLLGLALGFKTKAVSANATIELLTAPLILEESEILKVTAATANRLHVILSALESKPRDVVT